MQLANMFKKGINLGKNEGSGKRMTSPEVPEGILKKCNACKAAIFTEDVKKGYYICPKCGNYFRVHAMRRIEMIADPDTFEAWDEGLTSGNPLHYKGYEEKVKMLQLLGKLCSKLVLEKLYSFYNRICRQFSNG